MDSATIQRNLQMLGAMIRMRRLEQGLTQARLGMMMNTGQSYIYRIEAGKICLGIDTIMKIAEALDTDVKSLIEF